MPEATLTSKGQVTVPKAVRDHLGLSTGDRIAFVVRDDGVVELVARKRPLSALRGMLAGEVARVDDLAMATGDAAAFEYKRSLE